MKKIMFNNKYGLTKAVLERRKTQTRRIIPARIINYADTSCFLTFDKKPLSEEQKDYKCYETCDGDFIDIRYFAAYRVGEEVAIAQSYFDCGTKWAREHIDIASDLIKQIGYRNKMFVKAHLMPHRIKITNIRVERLHDIKSHWTDCLSEGVELNMDAPVGEQFSIERDGVKEFFFKATDAFAALIDKTCGRGTWDSNPYVFVYDFELVK